MVLTSVEPWADEGEWLIMGERMEIPDCRISASLIEISDFCRDKLKDMVCGISFCSSPLRWKYRQSRSNSARCSGERIVTG